MAYQERNIIASLVSFSLILGYYLVRVIPMFRGGDPDSESLFWLWGTVIVLAIIFTIVTIIFAHILSAIVQAIQTGEEEPEIDDTEDERDKLIDLKGVNASYIVASIGVFLAMLTFVLGQSPLVMFALLIFFGLVAQIVGDIAKLVLYRRGF